VLDDGDMTPFDPAQADANRVLFREYLTYEDKSAQLIAHVILFPIDLTLRITVSNTFFHDQALDVA
jgi:hypothetical protein